MSFYLTSVVIGEHVWLPTFRIGLQKWNGCINELCLNTA